MKKNRFFTELGDEGRTGLLGEGRFIKSDLRFEVLGSVDELSAVIGIAKSFIEQPVIKEQFTEIQRILYKIMAELSVVDMTRFQINNPILDSDIELLESQIHAISHAISLPGDFIIPGDSVATAQVDLARTVTRRVERRITELFYKGGFGNKLILQFINRLSSYFFSVEVRLLQDEKIAKPTLANK